MKDIDERTMLIKLYEIYKDLFNDKKQFIFEGYMLNDFTLSEIAQEVHISRQGVHDNVKQISRKLFEFEKALGLKAQKDRMKEVYQDIKLKLLIDPMDLEYVIETLEDLIEEL